MRSPSESVHAGWPLINHAGRFAAPSPPPNDVSSDEAGQRRVDSSAALDSVARRVVRRAAHGKQRVGVARLRRAVGFREVGEAAVENDQRALADLKPFEPAHVPGRRGLAAFELERAIGLAPEHLLQALAMLAGEPAQAAVAAMRILDRDQKLTTESGRV